MPKNVFLSALFIALIGLYPLLVYFGLKSSEPRLVALIIVAVALAKFFNRKSKQVAQSDLWLLIAALIITLSTFISGSALGLKLYPVVINLGMLTVFALSLRSGPSAVERLARLQEPDLPASGVIYTRKVTWVWCGFFVFNGSVAFITVFASDDIWALYNGLISYILMGVLFAGEYLVRRQHLRQRNSSYDD